MNDKTLHRLIGAIVFIFSLTVLLMTVQPSVSFWDCGEFTAAAFSMQVPHPPGTPLFSMIGRVFSMLPFASNTAYKVNLISVFASAFSVLFLYLIAVKIINNFKKRKPENFIQALTVYVPAAIGALSFSFSDTFWFNGVEAEVYASSTFLFAAIVYLMMLWNEKADSKDNEKYILMIAYLIGLSTGVHLMSVLAIVAVVMTVVFKKYVSDDKALKKTGYILLFHTGVILIIAFIMWGGQKSIAPPVPEEYAAFDTNFKLVAAAVSAVIMGFMWKKVFSKNSVYLPLMIGGAALFITYPGIVKLLPGAMAEISGDSIFTALLIMTVIFAILGAFIFYSVKQNKPVLHLIFMSIIFIVLGFTTYVTTIIRSNQNPPMNENRPKEFSQLVSYLNREQYGDFPIFKRRFASEMQKRGVFTNYTSDLDFFWRYQMNHMMSRYLLWNYAGRESWDQDAGVDIAPFNSIGNLIGKYFNIYFAGEAKDSLFGIPFLMGLLGIFYHFKRDWKTGLIFMILFIFMGYLTAFYQNQQQPQPRERDYFYVGAFFIFSVWIAVGVHWAASLVHNKINEKFRNKAAVFAVLAIAFLFVPVRMLQANYYTHDRSKNWFPWDISYNLLQSCAPNAVLFTNGDNDTFPLWYLQDVEGIRRDIKIVNLSLLNTSWYIQQLKNDDPYKTGKVEMRLSDEQIENIHPMAWKSSDITIPFPVNMSRNERNDFINQFGIEDTNVFSTKGITFRMNSTIKYGDVTGLRVQDILTKEIVENNVWKRPIYFSLTTPDNGKIGLNNYLRLEGLAQRLVPQKNNSGKTSINEKIMVKMLFEKNNGISKEYKPGFLFRGLDNPDIFYDEVHTRMMGNYYNAFINLSIFYLDNNMKEKAEMTLDTLMKIIPLNVIQPPAAPLFEVGSLYYKVDAAEKYKTIAKISEQLALRQLEKNPTDLQSYYNPYRVLLSIYERNKDYKNLAEIWNKILIMYPNDPNVKANVERYRQYASQKDTVN